MKRSEAQKSLRAKRATFTKRPGSKFKMSPFLLGQNSKFTPFYWVKIRNSPFFIGSKLKIYPFLLGHTL